MDTQNSSADGNEKTEKKNEKQNAEKNDSQAKPKTKARPKRIRNLPSRFTIVVKQVEGDHDPLVQSNLNRLKSAKTDFDQATGVVLTRRSETVGFRADQERANDVLEVSVHQLQGSLRATGSEDFVKGTQGRSAPETANKLIVAMTPEVLKHNGPLLKRVEHDLADYDRVNAAYQQALSDGTLAQDAYNRARKVLQFSLTATWRAWQYHQTQLALSKLSR
jgi:hypothetical protein